MKKANTWIILLGIFSSLVFLVLSANIIMLALGQVHARSTTDLSTYVDGANVKSEVLKANRGTIYDINGEVIAENISTYNIICILDKDRPSPSGVVGYVDDPIFTSRTLSNILDLEYSYILEQLSSDAYQVELGNNGRNLSLEVKELIDSYNLNGIEFIESSKRNYPMNSFSSHLIGFTQNQQDDKPKGMMGVELIYDDLLTGIDGYTTYQADRHGFILPGMKQTTTLANNGNNIYTTLNKELQKSLENAFLESYKLHGISKGWGSVMDIDTGKILALGQYPNFDPNTKEIEDYNNYASQISYEAGSVIKAITYAASINEGVYDGSKEFNSEPYCFIANGNTPMRTYRGDHLECINNSRDQSWGSISYDKGFVYSSNVATASLITEVITPSIYEKYLKEFGLFQKVNIDGMPEVIGTKNYTWPYDKLALSYGQGSSVTLIQLMQAFSAIFGDGYLVKPYFIESIIDQDAPNDIIYQADIVKDKRVISASTAKQVQDLMLRVVNDEDGTARFYKIPEVDIIAKTGTSQVAISTGYEDSDIVITSIMAALPANDPKYMIYYAFESEYNHHLHTSTQPVVGLLRKVAMYNNMHQQANISIQNSKQQYTMDDLTNNSLDYSLNKLDNITDNIIILGDGDVVLDQWPKEDQVLIANQRIFLLTSNNNIKMPNMIGWTRKDLSEFWELTNINMLIDGEGIVYNQSILVDNIININSVIEVKLKGE